MILVNLRRLSECSLCDRPTPVEFPTPNAKLYGDEHDSAQLCPMCTETAKAYARYARYEREEKQYR